MCLCALQDPNAEADAMAVPAVIDLDAGGEASAGAATDAKFESLRQLAGVAGP